MVAAEMGYLGLLKREFQKLQREDKTGKLQKQAAKLPREADTRGVSCYLRLQLQDVATRSEIEELYVLQDIEAGCNGKQC